MDLAGQQSTSFLSLSPTLTLTLIQWWPRYVSSQLRSLTSSWQLWFVGAGVTVGKQMQPLSDEEFEEPMLDAEIDPELLNVRLPYFPALALDGQLQCSIGNSLQLRNLSLKCAQWNAGRRLLRGADDAGAKLGATFARGMSQHLIAM